MKVLMADVGGTNVKLMASGHEGVRKFKSGRGLTARQMVSKSLETATGWEFDAVTIGFPGLVANGQPVRDPLNLGGGWVGFDFEAAFARPVRIINDAAMQALANYEGGRMLFLGFGTSIGSTLIVDDTVIPIELGLLRIGKKQTFVGRLSDAALQQYGRKKWQRAVETAVAILRDAFWPTDTVLGGGNAKLLNRLPPGCRRSENQEAFIGANRLWKGADMVAEARGTSWLIRRRSVERGTFERGTFERGTRNAQRAK
jgi:polyphosphate glucokinase